MNKDHLIILFFSLIIINDVESYQELCKLVQLLNPNIRIEYKFNIKSKIKELKTLRDIQIHKTFDSNFPNCFNELNTLEMLIITNIYNKI